MTSHFYKNIPGWECEIISILKNININNRFWMFIKDERKNSIISPYEIMTIIKNKCMWVLDRGFTIDPKNMN